jgi:biotin synthase
MSFPIRSDWSRDEVAAIYHRPLLELLFEAQRVHRAHQPRNEVQCAALLSIKTGGCPENCGYCPQSAHFETDVARTDLLAVDEVLAAARDARAGGAARFCLGAAYRSVPDGEPFERILSMVRGIRAEGMEACVTLGMLRPDQAERLAQAGLTAYNHNLDTGAKHYDRVVTTRTYEDRLRTLRAVAAAGISVCCGGILGLRETDADRVDLLHALATLSPHPESVPINVLVPVAGTPMADAPPVDPIDVARAVATARILMPAARVRLSAGRSALSDAEHALCFLAGANSIFAGDRLLTTPNVEGDRDATMFARLGLTRSVPGPAAAAVPSSAAAP